MGTAETLERINSNILDLHAIISGVSTRVTVIETTLIERERAEKELSDRKKQRLKNTFTFVGVVLTVIGLAFTYQTILDNRKPEHKSPVAIEQSKPR